MKTFLLEREQWLARPVEEVFSFFADATNLEAITPPWLGFHILSPTPIVMRAGRIILYRVRWGWLPLRWSRGSRSGNRPFASWTCNCEALTHSGTTRIRSSRTRAGHGYGTTFATLCRWGRWGRSCTGSASAATWSRFLGIERKG